MYAVILAMAMTAEPISVIDGPRYEVISVLKEDGYVRAKVGGGPVKEVLAEPSAFGLGRDPAVGDSVTVSIKPVPRATVGGTSEESRRLKDAWERGRNALVWVGHNCIPCEVALPNVEHIHVDGPYVGTTGPAVVVYRRSSAGGFDKVNIRVPASGEVLPEISRALGYASAAPTVTYAAAPAQWPGYGTAYANCVGGNCAPAGYGTVYRTGYGDYDPQPGPGPGPQPGPDGGCQPGMQGGMQFRGPVRRIFGGVFRGRAMRGGGCCG